MSDEVMYIPLQLDMDGDYELAEVATSRRPWICWKALHELWKFPYGQKKIWIGIKPLGNRYTVASSYRLHLSSLDGVVWVEGKPRYELTISAGTYLRCGCLRLPLDLEVWLEYYPEEETE